jgi:phage host-nuclease inhibitor protein Gam
LRTQPNSLVHDISTNKCGLGDLVALIKILKSAGGSLKASGGSADDFQHVVKQLEDRAAVLETIANDKAITGNQMYSNAIRAQAQSMTHKIKRLLADIQPYEKTLGFGFGARAKESTPRSVVQKIKWATRGSKYVEHQQRKTDASFLTEQLLFSLNTR